MLPQRLNHSLTLFNSPSSFLKDCPNLEFKFLNSSMFLRSLEKSRPSFSLRGFSNEASLKNQNLEKEAIKILHQQLKARKQDFVMTSDKYRVDIGFVAYRYPIFLDIPMEQLEMLKIRIEMGKKWDRNLVMHKDFFNKVRESRERGGPHEADNATATHEYTNKNGEIVNYSDHSRYFRSVDPNIRNPKSTQFAPTEMTYLIYKNLEGKWGFPSLQIRVNERIQDARDRILNQISDGTKVHWVSSSPVGVIVQKFPQSEIKNARDPIGKKVFFFDGVHLGGNTACNREHYQDCLWTTKQTMKQFFDRGTFQKFALMLNHY